MQSACMMYVFTVNIHYTQAASASEQSTHNLQAHEQEKKSMYRVYGSCYSPRHANTNTNTRVPVGWTSPPPPRYLQSSCPRTTPAHAHTERCRRTGQRLASIGQPATSPSRIRQPATITQPRWPPNLGAVAAGALKAGAGAPNPPVCCATEPNPPNTGAAAANAPNPLAGAGAPKTVLGVAANPPPKPAVAGAAAAPKAAEGVAAALKPETAEACAANGVLPATEAKPLKAPVPGVAGVAPKADGWPKAGAGEAPKAGVAVRPMPKGRAPMPRLEDIPKAGPAAELPNATPPPRGEGWPKAQPAAGIEGAAAGGAPKAREGAAAGAAPNCDRVGGGGRGKGVSWETGGRRPQTKDGVGRKGRNLHVKRLRGAQTGRRMRAEAAVHAGTPQ